MDGAFQLDHFIAEPAVRHKPNQSSEVRPDANRVVYSPLVAVTVSQIRKIPFGVLASLTLTEQWFPVNDVPPHARHRVSPDPNEPGTWDGGDKLPKPRLASVLVNSDVVLARVLQTYSEQGCREILTLRDKTADEIRATQSKLFGAQQIRTYVETVAAIKAALDQHKDDKLVIGTAREIMKQCDEALRACEIYWDRRKIEIMRAANGDTSFVAHPDNYDLRMCEFAGIDPTKTEADALRAEVLKRQLEPAVAAGPTPEAFAEAMKAAVAEGVKQGIAAATAVQAEPKNGKQQR